MPKRAMKKYSDEKISAMITDWKNGLKKIDFCSKHGMTEYCFKVFNKELKAAGIKRNRGFQATFKQGISCYLSDIKHHDETKSPPMPKISSPKPKTKRKAKAKPMKKCGHKFHTKFKRKFGRSPIASSDESESESESEADSDPEVEGVGRKLSEVKSMYPNFSVSDWDAAEDKLFYLDNLDS